jgi:hypothetical protein
MLQKDISDCRFIRIFISILFFVHTALFGWSIYIFMESGKYFKACFSMIGFLAGLIGFILFTLFAIGKEIYG